VTFRKGHPAGEAAGLVADVTQRQRDRINAELPDIKKQLASKDSNEASKGFQRMQELGVPPGLQRFYSRQAQQPSISRKAVQQLYRAGTPEEIRQFERSLR
jgi:hypothetical protein